MSTPTLSILLLSACLIAGSACARAETDVVRLKYPTAPQDLVYSKQAEYYKALLELVMSKTGVRYSIESVDVPLIPTSRALRYLDNDLFNIMMLHTDSQVEQDLLPIRIPIYRGLTGWRLFLIRETDQQRFDKIKNVEQLRRLAVGQGHEWPDTSILNDSGLNVITAPHRNNLFKMLHHGRIDYFPRGLFEIWDEVPLARKSGLQVEQSIALHYPTAFYYFMSKKNHSTAKIVEQGFLKAVADGSFQKLFYTRFNDVIRKANLHSRNIISIPNRTLTELTPTDDPRLWFNPRELNQNL